HTMLILRLSFVPAHLDLYPLPTRRSSDLPFGECWAEPHHIHRHIKHNLGLVTVGGTPIHLGPFLAIPAQEQERHSGGKLRLPLLDRKSTRLNSSHVSISYAVFCLTKNKKV